MLIDIAVAVIKNHDVRDASIGGHTVAVTGAGKERRRIIRRQIIGRELPFIRNAIEVMRQITRAFIQRDADEIYAVAILLFHPMEGFDLLFEILPHLSQIPMQLVVVGSGNEDIMKKMLTWSGKCKNIHYFDTFDVKLASQIYAASDIFLMPSKFEPCGLGQLIAMRYGTIPVVRSVGGLKDTVLDYEVETKSGTGFVFKNYDAIEFLVAMVRAFEHYKHKKSWDALVLRAMAVDHSWEQSVKKYEKEFYSLLQSK